MTTQSRPIEILLVDDDELSREVLELLLAAEGYAVIAVDAGEAALAEMEQRTGRLPAVILTDVQMPGLSGAELASQLRCRCGDGMVLLGMSGSRPAPAILEAFDGFLMKPFTMQDLATTLDACAQTALPATPQTILQTTAPLSATNTSSRPSLDEATYRQMSNMMPRQQVHQLYAMALQDVEKRMAAMRMAAERGDTAEYLREAHAIKGGCGMIGALELQSLAAYVEEEGTGANHVASLHEMMLACERLRRILVAHVDSVA